MGPFSDTMDGGQHVGRAKLVEKFCRQGIGGEGVYHSLGAMPQRMYTTSMAGIWGSTQEGGNLMSTSACVWVGDPVPRPGQTEQSCCNADTVEIQVPQSDEPQKLRRV